jgi:hypothetical protein
VPSTILWNWTRKMCTFNHNAHKADSITNRNMQLRGQQNELPLKEEVKTQPTPVIILLK